MGCPWSRPRVSKVIYFMMWLTYFHHRYLRAGGVPTRHTHKWDGLHTRHLLESTHTNTQKQKQPHSVARHEIHLGTRSAGEKVDDTEEVTVSLFIRLRRRGSGGEGDWETVVLVTAQMAGASSREGMGLHGGDGAPGRRGLKGRKSPGRACGRGPCVRKGWGTSSVRCACHRCRRAQ